MLFSMTGYGRASVPLKDKNMVVEIKSLNSKFLDLRIKSPTNLQKRELELRKLIGDQLLRGKIETTIAFTSASGGESYAINKEAFKLHYQTLLEITSELHSNPVHFLDGLLRIPDVVSTYDEPLSEEEWRKVIEVTTQAVEQIKNHREIEGASICDDLKIRIELILKALGKVKPYEEARIEKVKERIMNNLQEFPNQESVDANRFEQELFFYIEKLDISEEKVRLEQHCHYFLEELFSLENVKGKKLNFISQEMGREINTLGAKAYSSEIQKLVVSMKDELEKIKEQLANIL